VSLIKKPVLYLKELSIRTKIIDLESQTGKILLKFNVDSLITSDIKLNFVIKPKNFEGEILNDTHLMSVSPGNNLVEKEITIYNAKFWWTHDHGYPFLYDLDIIANFNGRDIDILNTFFGIKEIKLIRNNGWQVFLNNKRIFIKGSNYAPQKHRIAKSTREDYEQDVDLMVNANFNMVRVHAHIDRNELHEIASEKGILIWQDFPLQWYYNKTVIKSAKDQTKRIVNQLKNYPSQGIWCCHNEPFKIPTKNEIIKLLFLIICSIFSYIGFNFLFNLYLSLPITISKIYSIIIILTIFIGISLIFDLIPTVLFYNWNINTLDKKIADLISKLDPDHPILKASGLLGRTDLHWYDGWYFNPGKYWKANKFSKKFLKCFAPFVTEYGAQSFPNVESLEKFKINLKWPFNEETWLNLKKNFRCQSNIVKKIFKINSFKTLDDFIHATQQYQSSLLKFHNELWRKLRYNPTGGAICFLFNDCSPLITWSVIDYFRKPKLAYESVSLSFEPLYALLSKWPRKFKKNSLFKNSILLINDYLHDVHDINIKLVVKSPTNTILENNYDCNIKADSIIQIDQLKFIIPNEIGEYSLDIYLSSEINSILNSYKFIVN